MIGGVERTIAEYGNAHPTPTGRRIRDTEHMHALLVIAKLIADMATGEAAPEPTPRGPEKNPAAVALGKLGGAKGRKRRAETLTPERRSEIAKRAAQSRWQSRDEG